MKKHIFWVTSGVVFYLLTTAFCGFYVTNFKEGLTNKSSSVIIARKGAETVITMQSDVHGNVGDFAMVVPVPEVLKKKQIKTISPSIFKKLSDYSAPRLTEYNDSDPCTLVDDRDLLRQLSGRISGVQLMKGNSSIQGKDRYQVKIRENFQVSCYDIVLLSAKNAAGLQLWLTDHGYKIPAHANELLSPYIKSGMFFFVVKVDQRAWKQMNISNLPPIQMRYSSNRFMLPLRLGMANAEGPQDMIVYAFSDQGRIEPANYRMIEIPTDKPLPTFAEERFNEVYERILDQKLEKNGRNVLALEYSWNISGNNSNKCDPCPTNPMSYEELAQAGVFWLDPLDNSYKGDLHFTRMRVRYDEEHFPQDIQFQATPNTSNYQVRYFITHPYPADLSCPDAFPYYQSVMMRRQEELHSFYKLTNYADMLYASDYVKEYVEMANKALPAYEEAVKLEQERMQKEMRLRATPLEEKLKKNILWLGRGGKLPPYFGLLMLGLIPLIYFYFKRNPQFKKA